MEIKQKALKKEIKTDLAKMARNWIEIFNDILPYMLFLYVANRYLVADVYIKIFNRFEGLGTAHAANVANAGTALTLVTCLILIYIIFKHPAFNYKKTVNKEYTK